VRHRFEGTTVDRDLLSMSLECFPGRLWKRIVGEMKGWKGRRFLGRCRTLLRPEHATLLRTFSSVNPIRTFRVDLTWILPQEIR
jgi:hypothetical protein